jgi:hypothetical protein
MTIRLKYVLLCALVSGCVHTVKISYPPESVIHPTFDEPYTIWKGEWVQVDGTPLLHAESFKYLVAYNRVLLADSIRQRGLRNEFKVAGKGTPLVVYTENPKATPEEKHYPASGIALGITAVKEERRGKVPLLKLYDSLDPVVVRSSTGPNPIAANYTATLAVLYSHARRVAGSAAGSFLRPDNPRFATGIYMIHPYDPTKFPSCSFMVLFLPRFHGRTWSTISAQTRKYSSTINLGFFFIRPANRPLKVRCNFGRTSKQRNVCSTQKASLLPRTMSSSSRTAWEDCLRTP